MQLAQNMASASSWRRITRINCPKPDRARALCAEQCGQMEAILKNRDTAIAIINYGTGHVIP
ncbi:MAG: hypothetical protein ACLR0U_29245 [Enterocloster clostridioformis]